MSMAMLTGIDFLPDAEYIRPFQDPIFLRVFTALLLIKLSHESSDSDVKALLDVKLRLNSTTLADWTGTYPCNWTGIQCVSNDVVGLSLPRLNLTGTLDPAMCNIPSLRLLNLSHNFFYGPTPSGLRNCYGLQILDISENNFDGNLSVFADMTNLTSLNVAGNNFSGTIPRNIGTFNKLRVLNLSSNALFDTIPDEIANCTDLQILDFRSNRLSNTIPPSFFQLTRLQHLALSDNNLYGHVPGFLSTFSELRVLRLSKNNFSGPIPPLLSNLTKLRVLSISQNKISGKIPTELGNLSAVTRLFLNLNQLTGPIPNELGKLSSLSRLSLSTNQLTGSIPPELFECRNLTRLLLASNRLNSSIPWEIGRLGQLEELDLSENELTGRIPAQLGNCSSLREIDLSDNSISGELPQVLAIANLTQLLLQHNGLIGGIPPDYMALQALEYIDLSYNSLTGMIPDNFSSTSSLLSVILAGNLLTGGLPLSLGKLRRLQMLDVGENNLVGDFNQFEDYSEEDYSVSQLQYLKLNENGFTGGFPTFWISCMHGLLTLDFHGNKLSGSIPGEIKNLVYVLYIDLSSNEFVGPIPEDIGKCSYLTFLNLSSNYLADEIPPNIANSWDIDNVQILVDFSGNNLSGGIPLTLNVSNLILNVSNNHLSGPIPSQLQKLSTTNFFGNPSLCGPPLSNSCPPKFDLAEDSHKIRLVILVAVCGSVAIVTVLGLVFFLTKLNCRRRSEVDPGIDGPSVVIHFLDGTWLGQTCSNAKSEKKRPEMKLTFADLYRATGGFSPDDVIGDGGFGKVYRGVLLDGTTVAIKKLTEDGYQGEREFIAELETLGKLRHKNLVQLFAFCSKNSERLLVYEYMPNDSLDVWLHNRTETMAPLSWDLRMIIAKDVARGLTFLHHFCVPKVIHRDLKASNILLDANFNARLADFGLARHLNTYESHVSTAVAGSLGYIAPEYARCWRVTTRGDVFSFGVVLLELLSGLRPACGLYKPIHGGNLVGWVQYLLTTHQISEHFFDAALGSVRGTDLEKRLMAALEIAIQCTHEIPSKRPTMLEVLRILEESL